MHTFVWYTVQFCARKMPRNLLRSESTHNIFPWQFMCFLNFIFIFKSNSPNLLLFFFFFFKSRFCLDSVTRLSKFTFESNFDRICVGPYVDWRLENMYIWPILYGALVLFMVGEFKKVLRVFGVTFTFSLITWCGTLTSWQIANIYLFIYLNK